MKTNNSVLYIGGFDLPDKNAAAHRVLNNGKVLRELGYEVVFVTRHIEDVKLCDVLIVANFSRISRKQMEFVKTYKMFKARGIRIESVSGHEVESIFSADDIYKAFESFEREFNK